MLSHQRIIARLLSVAGASVALSVVATGSAGALPCPTCGVHPPPPPPNSKPTPPPPPPPYSGPGAGSGTQEGSDGTGNQYGWNERPINNPFVTVTLHTNPIEGKSAWWMETTATLDTETGVLSYKSHVEDDNWFGGYTGAVTVFGTDQKGDILATTPESTVMHAGVCGTGEKWFCGNQQEVTGGVQMTGDYHDVTGLVIVNWHDVHNRLGEDLSQLGGILSSASTVATSVVALINTF